MTTSHKDLQAISQAAAGLLFPSESDYPLELFTWQVPQPPTSTDLRAAAERGEQAPIVTLSADAFFHPACQLYEGQTEAERQHAIRFTGLLRLLKERLADLTVYKIGRVEIAVYIVGRSADGQYIGLRTTVVET